MPFARSFLLALAPMAAALAGCSAADPRSCTVACSAEGACPDGTSCGADGFCHAADEEPGVCADIDGSVIGGEDATAGMDGSVDPPDGGSGADACSGADTFTDEVLGPISIPDASLSGISSTIEVDAPCAVVRTVEVAVDITHTYVGDLRITLTSPSGEEDELLSTGSAATPDLHDTFSAEIADGQSAAGAWQLTVADEQRVDVGTLDRWSLGINQDAP
jgi:hypothetical protein